MGCGSGRDLLWLKNRGFHVTGFDRSFEMATLARTRVECAVIVGDFMVFDFSRFAMDAVLLVGALVHLPQAQLGKALSNIAAALKEDGLILLTMKEGSGSSTDRDGRVFQYWSDEGLRKLLQRREFHIVHFHRQNSVKNDKDVWLTYVLEMK